MLAADSAPQTNFDGFLEKDSIFSTVPRFADRPADVTFDQPPMSRQRMMRGLPLRCRVLLLTTRRISSLAARSRYCRHGFSL
jgi:hypothetical protein